MSHSFSIADTKQATTIIDLKNKLLSITSTANNKYFIEHNNNITRNSYTSSCLPFPRLQSLAGPSNDNQTDNTSGEESEFIAFNTSFDRALLSTTTAIRKTTPSPSTPSEEQARLRLRGRRRDSQRIDSSTAAAAIVNHQSGFAQAATTTAFGEESNYLITSLRNYLKEKYVPEREQTHQTSYGANDRPSQYLRQTLSAYSGGGVTANGDPCDRNQKEFRKNTTNGRCLEPSYCVNRAEQDIRPINVLYDIICKERQNQRADTRSEHETFLSSEVVVPLISQRLTSLLNMNNKKNEANGLMEENAEPSAFKKPKPMRRDRRNGSERTVSKDIQSNSIPCCADKCENTGMTSTIGMGRRVEHTSNWGPEAKGQCSALCRNTPTLTSSSSEDSKTMVNVSQGPGVTKASNSGVRTTRTSRLRAAALGKDVI